MQINIKSIGYKVGTSGWIKEQLESGAAASTKKRGEMVIDARDMPADERPN